jgi:putative transposase
VKNLIEKDKVPLKIALRATILNKSTYYHRPDPARDRRKKPMDEKLVSQLKALPKYEQTYGYRKVTKYFKKYSYNHKKIYRHMKALNLTQLRKLKKHNKNRLDVSSPIQSNVRWEGDLTYVYDGKKTNYLFVVIDAYDKEPIGDYYGLRCRADEAVYSLEDAVKTRFGSLEPYAGYRVALRVDQGSQYISKKFKKRAKELGIKLEYCGINCPNDKPHVECFFARYKCEEVYRNEYQSYPDALLGWLEYKEWYSSKRIHQGLGWSTLPEFKATRDSHLVKIFWSNNMGA